MGVESVGHEFKLPVGRYEGDGTIVLKAGETHALVKLDVFQLDRLALSSLWSRELEDWSRYGKKDGRTNGRTFEKEK